MNVEEYCRVEQRPLILLICELHPEYAGFCRESVDILAQNSGYNVIWFHCMFKEL